MTTNLNAKTLYLAANLQQLAIFTGKAGISLLPSRCVFVFVCVWHTQGSCQRVWHTQTQLVWHCVTYTGSCQRVWHKQNPKSTSNQSSKPCTVLQYPSRKVWHTQGSCQRVWHTQTQLVWHTQLSCVRVFVYVWHTQGSCHLVWHTQTQRHMKIVIWRFSCDIPSWHVTQYGYRVTKTHRMPWVASHFPPKSH